MCDPEPKDNRPIEEVIAEITKDVPAESWAKLDAESPLPDHANAAIRGVYEKYKHMDTLLCVEPLLPGAAFQRRLLYDLWQAIRLIVEEAKA